MSGAAPNADSAAAAGVTVNTGGAVLHGNGLIRTGHDTLTATDALRFIPGNLYAATLAFWIGTPFTAQGTALYKYDRADAGTVIDAEFLNIKDQASGRGDGFHNTAPFCRGSNTLPPWGGTES